MDRTDQWADAHARLEKRQTCSTVDVHAEAYVFPRIGQMQVANVATADIVGALKPIWSQKPETANRVRQSVEAVLDYASALGIRKGDNPARWRGHLDHLLPKPKKVRAVKHHPALPHADIADFMADLSNRTGVAAQALGLRAAHEWPRHGRDGG